MPRTSATPPSPKKLLNSKWTAVNPRNREKHFLVTKLVDPEPPGSPLLLIELEALISKQVRVMPWRELADETRWIRGWV